MQKQNASKYENFSNNAKINNIASEVNNKKRNFETRSNNAIKTRNLERKKGARDARRSTVKVDVENEDRIAMPTNRQRLKEGYKEDHDIW